MNSNTTLEEVWALFRETDRKMQETFNRLTEEARERQREAEQRQRETDRQLRELGKQIGGLGNKFGSFTEGLALPSMEKILRRRFGVDTIAPSVRVSRGDRHLELDVLAYANDEVNAAYVVEVKSHLREEHIQQLLEILEQFAGWFPEHRSKQLYGILAAVPIPAALRPRVLEQGLYLAHIHNDLFELEVPDDFQPRRFDRPVMQPA
jgi:hypothetical protein